MRIIKRKLSSIQDFFFRRAKTFIFFSRSFLMMATINFLFGFDFLGKQESRRVRKRETGRTKNKT